MKIIKQALTEYDPRIDEWDEPVVRNFNGKKVIGRPTKAYGTKPFEYAGKLYEPEPWSLSMQIIKVAAEYVVFKNLNKIVRFNFCLCGLYFFFPITTIFVHGQGYIMYLERFMM